MNDDLNQKTTKQDFSAQQNLTQEAENLSRLSEDQLMHRLREEVQKQKSDGTFNHEALVLSLQKLQPFIGVASFEKLMNIVEKLK